MLLELVILYLLVRGAAEAWKETKAAWGRSRHAYTASAGRRYPGMSPRRRAASAVRHDLGYGLSQLLHGFPTARHGFAQGWSEGRQAHVEARTARERARTEHAETRAGALAEWGELRERRREAQEEIRRQRQGSGEEVPSGTEACGHAPEACLFPASCPCSCAGCLAAHASWVGREPGEDPGDKLSECPVCGAYGTEGHVCGGFGVPFGAPLVNERQRERDADPRLRNACSACGHDGTDNDPLVLTSGGSRVHRSHTLDPDSGFYGYGSTGNPPPECWLCGLPVVGDELGASAHQRCVEVNDRDMNQTEIPDVRDVDEVERDLRSRGVCPHQVEYGNGGSPRYCGQPINGDDDEFCPYHQAEDEGDYDRAADEVQRHTRELLAQDNPGQSVPGGGSSPTEGTTSMSDVTYGDVVARVQAAAGAAEQRSAETWAALNAAEEKQQEAEGAKNWAHQTADQMQALNVDAATLGAMADHLDAADSLTQAHQHAREALEAVRAAEVRMMETAQNVDATLQRGHGGLQQAHDDAPVTAADREFYAS